MNNLAHFPYKWRGFTYSQHLLSSIVLCLLFEIRNGVSLEGIALHEHNPLYLRIHIWFIHANPHHIEWNDSKGYAW
jgi:hypothetical protein